MLVNNETMKKQIEKISHDIENEITRLMLSGAIGDNTTIGTVLKVAIENVSMQFSYNKKDYNNLKKI